jgi:DNA-binding LacI/PurR family transcriptional regulator
MPPDKNKDEETLYQKIQLDFFQKVYSGEIAPHQSLPPERKQAEELSISRGTVRKARKMLMDEGFISSTQGSAAVYTPLKKRKKDKLEIIAVVAAIHNPFFMAYYRAFEKAAEEKGVLVMIKQLENRNVLQLEKVLFSLFLKGIKDIVFWPYDTVLEYDSFQRLSGLGMHVVFFDKVHDLDFCDYISVDNDHAITSLYKLMNKKGIRTIAYIGWDSQVLTSNVEREKAFSRVKTEDDVIIKLPWNQENLTDSLLEEHFNVHKLIEKQKLGGILCGNGHIGIALRRFLNNKGFPGIPLYSMDNFEGSETLNITSYEQSFDVMGVKTFNLLHDRHTKEDWHSRKYYIKGRIIKR